MFRVESVGSGQFLFSKRQECECRKLFDREPEWKMPRDFDVIKVLRLVRGEFYSDACGF